MRRWGHCKVLIAAATAVVCVSLIPTAGYTQDCDKILADGLWDIKSGSTTQSKQQSFMNWLCSKQS
jgi:hypothetical protein